MPSFYASAFKLAFVMIAALAFLGCLVAFAFLAVRHVITLVCRHSLWPFLDEAFSPYFFQTILHEYCSMR